MLINKISIIVNLFMFCFLNVLIDFWILKIIIDLSCLVLILNWVFLNANVLTFINKNNKIKIFYLINVFF